MNTATKRPSPGETVVLQHWDGSVEKAKILQYQRGAVLLEYADNVAHWWPVSELLSALHLSN